MNHPRWNALLALTAAVVLTGCGGGLTGGSIPTGSASLSTVRGQVVSSTDLQTPVSGAEVELEDSRGQRHTKQADAQGVFEFDNVPPGPIHIKVMAPGAGPFRPVDVQFDLETGDEIDIALVMHPPTAPPVAGVSGLRIDPAKVTLTVGQSQRFIATVNGQNVTGLRPFWRTQGRIGPISPDGVFQAMHAGRGRVIAFIDGHEAVAEITVLPSPGNS